MLACTVSCTESRRPACFDSQLGKRIACAVHVSDLSGFSLKMVFTPGNITDYYSFQFILYKRLFIGLCGNAIDAFYSLRSIFGLSNLASSVVLCGNNTPKCLPCFSGIPDMMKEVFALIEANYPEDLYSSIVINGQ